ncbi:MAG: orotidine-5'-phosphate decarboxylase [Anaerolineales bacterium]|nr:orotidine-5'-phosphate decarboxylase [Anaerolineales bacterium]
MISFANLLEFRTRQANSLLCVGLDPHPADLAVPTPTEARDFCLRLIEATADLAAAFKPNAAFFEALGPYGMAALQEVIAAIPDGIPVILDAKRGDIASTAEAYAQAAFHVWKVHAITLSPYLGRDSLEPFLNDPARGAFLLCKTSNPGAGDLQDLRLAGEERCLFEQVAHLAQQWNTNDNLGLVAGATHPAALRQVRDLAPDLWILAPGVGAQGGDLAEALGAGLRADGLGLLVPVSRAISRAGDPRQAARDLRDEINRLRSQAGAVPSSLIQPERMGLADALLEAGCVRFGQFTLKSGLQSPIYIDLRQLVSFPRLLQQVADAYLPTLRSLEFDRLAALPYAAIPIATAVSLCGGWPMLYPRKEAKTYGTKAEIEGLYQPGEKVVLLDDLATTGGSKFEAIEKLKAAGLDVSDVVVLIDRQSGAQEALAEAGYRLHPILRLGEMLDHWERSARVEQEHIRATRAFLTANTAEV